MSKKDKERKDAEKKQKKEAKKLKAEKAVEAVKEKAAKKKADLDDLLGEIPTVHTDELQKYAEKHEKMAESDDKAEDEILTTVSTEKAPAAIGPYSQAIIAGDLTMWSRPPASWRTWLTLPPLMKYTVSISPKNPPGAASPLNRSPRAFCVK